MLYVSPLSYILITFCYKVINYTNKQEIMKNLIPSCSTEIPRQMNGEKINIAGTSDAQNSCIRDI